MTDELEADATAHSAAARSELELQDHFAVMEQATYLSRVDRMRAAMERRKRKRARVEPESVAPAGGATSAPDVALRLDRARMRRRLLAFYAIHDESKLAKVDALVEKYGAVPEKLLASLCAKYGVDAVPTVPLRGQDVLPERGGALRRRRRTRMRTRRRTFSTFSARGSGGSATRAPRWCTRQRAWTGRRTRGARRAVGSQ